jgi:CcmD family protein
MVNTYLMLAYAFVWLIFMLYAWSLSRRQARLRRELDDLKSRLLRQTSSSRSSS